MGQPRPRPRRAADAGPPSRERPLEPLERRLDDPAVRRADLGLVERRLQALVGVEQVTGAGQLDEAGAAAAVLVDEGDDPRRLLVNAHIVVLRLKYRDLGVERHPGGRERRRVELPRIRQGAPEQPPAGEQLRGRRPELGPPPQRLRGREGSWQRALLALRLLREAGSKISVNTQINRLTWHDLPELLERIAVEGIHAWQVQLTVAHGGAADHHELLLQPYMYLELFPILDRIADRCDALEITITPANSLGYFGPHDYKLRRRQSRQGHYLGCQAGIAGVAIESDGAIKNCPSLGGRNNIGGSWREHGLRAVWERAPELAYMRKRTEKELWGYCAECYYAPMCKGGCTSVSEPLLGRPGNNPMCHHRALEMDRMGLRERIEWVRPSTGEPFDNSLFRVIREHKDPALRATHGPVQVDEPRTARADEAFGPGTPVDLST